MDEYEKFYTEIWQAGNSLVVTIPIELSKFADLTKGQAVIVMIKKNTTTKE